MTSTTGYSGFVGRTSRMLAVGVIGLMIFACPDSGPSSAGGSGGSTPPPEIQITVGESDCPPDRVRLHNLSVKAERTSGLTYLVHSVDVYCLSAGGTEYPLPGVPLSGQVQGGPGPIGLGTTNANGTAGGRNRVSGMPSDYANKTFNVSVVANDGSVQPPGAQVTITADP